jgi:hypothetical protein
VAGLGVSSDTLTVTSFKVQSSRFKDQGFEPCFETEKEKRDTGISTDGDQQRKTNPTVITLLSHLRITHMMVMKL